MDLDLLRELKFGENTQWELKYKCGWCFKPIKNQTEARYKEKGNICERCSGDITRRVLEHNYERDITQTERMIEKD